MRQKTRIWKNFCESSKAGHFSSEVRGSIHAIKNDIRNGQKMIENIAKMRMFKPPVIYK